MKVEVISPDKCSSFISMEDYCILKFGVLKDGKLVIKVVDEFYIIDDGTWSHVKGFTQKIRPLHSGEEYIIKVKG